MWLGPLLERIVGALFVFSATVKVVDLPAFELQVRYYNILSEPAAIAVAALGVVIVESVLGIALLTGVRMRGGVPGAAVALLLGFTGLVAYSWAFHGLEECGCFGGVVEMTPAVTISKNIVMIAVLALASKAHGWRAGGTAHRAHPGVRAALGAGGAAIVLVAAAYGGAGAGSLHGEQPFAELAYHDGLDDVSLAEGKHLAAFYGATCEHCMITVGPLNELAVAEDAPRVVAFIIGEAGEIEEFELITQPLFPLIAMDIVEFSRFVGPAPPRFVLVRDGRALAHWDDDPPAPEAVAELLRR